MKTKYADLIKQLDRVTDAYELALSSALNLERVTAEQQDVIGVSGGVEYYGDSFEKNRAIHIRQDVFTLVALDCGSNFSYENKADKGYVRFCCTVFGYRVFSLIGKGSLEESYLMEKVKSDE